MLSTENNICNTNDDDDDDDDDGGGYNVSEQNVPGQNVSAAGI